MAVLDVTIVNVASPAVRSDLHTSGSVLQLIVAGYTVAYSTLLITGARAGDRFGHARVLAIGVLCFTLMSFICGMAPNSFFLVLARLLQGASAAFMVPQVMSLIQRTFEGHGRARAIGLYGAVIAIGAICGQIVGGLLVGANILHLVWRPIFLVNVPIGVALFALVLGFVPRRGGDSARSFDLIGVVCLMATVASFVIPLVFGPGLGWPVWSIVLLVLVVPLAVLSAWHERRASGRDPILSAEVVGARGFVWLLLFMVLMQSSYAGSLLAQALHFEAGLGLSALHTGLLFITGGVGFALGSLTWRRFPTWIHTYFMIGGMLIGAAGYVIMAWSLRTATDPASLYLTVNFGLSAAFGYGFGPILSMALSHVPLKFAGSASGVLVSTLQIGQLLGIAVYGSIYFALVHNTSAKESAGAFAHTLYWAALACVVGALAGLVFIRMIRVKEEARP
ncbi:MFS transporter [Kribbella kalugense]|uniref:MFS transporter n=2 Tax=Kribbella kalugense TaxID=2512221 RepID=A0A4R8A267_9ACTN|nr:MFS transporter [Kribbella kalugense]